MAKNGKTIVQRLVYKLKTGVRSHPHNKATSSSASSVRH